MARAIPIFLGAANILRGARLRRCNRALLQRRSPFQARPSPLSLIRH